jgi:hypothetical protein
MEFITSPQQAEASDASFALELRTCPMKFIHSKCLADKILNVRGGVGMGEQKEVGGGR